MSARPKRSLSFPARSRNQRPHLTAAFTAARATAGGARHAITIIARARKALAMLARAVLTLFLLWKVAPRREATRRWTTTSARTVTPSPSRSRSQRRPHGAALAPPSEGGDGDNNGRSNAAMPVLKVGGKAEHPTLGEVSVLVLGALGAKIEFFSVLW